MPGTLGMKRNSARAILLTAAAGAVSLGMAAGSGRAQPFQPLRGATQLERFERDLQQIRQQTYNQVNQDVPANERAYFDYGAYLTLSYLTLQDNNNDNHILRQGEVFPRARSTPAGAHEFFIRGRVGYRGLAP